MNPEFVFVLGCFGIGLAVAVLMWTIMDESLRKLERSVSHARLATRRLDPANSSGPREELRAAMQEEFTREFEDSWKPGDSYRGLEPSLDEYWDRAGSSKSASLLNLLVEADLRNRFARGQSPSVAGYIKRYPQLAKSPDRVVSLVVEEIRLLAKRGEILDSSRFLDPYRPWGGLILRRLESEDVAWGHHNPMQPAKVSM